MSDIYDTHPSGEHFVGGYSEGEEFCHCGKYAGHDGDHFEGGA